jgi:hypothetical protein
VPDVRSAVQDAGRALHPRHGPENGHGRDRALAAGYWLNLHYFHCTEGVCNYWGTGYSKGDMFIWEYWNGLFAFGYGISGEAPVVEDWHVVRCPPEAPDFFALGMLWGTVELKEVEGSVRARFSTTAGRPFLLVGEHLVYKVRKQGPTEVTFAWKEGEGPLKTGSHTYSASDTEHSSWTIKSGQNVSTVWVEESAR